MLAEDKPKTRQPLPTMATTIAPVSGGMKTGLCCLGAMKRSKPHDKGPMRLAND